MRWFVDEFFVRESRQSNLFILSKNLARFFYGYFFLLLNLECKALVSLTFPLDPSKLPFLMTKKKAEIKQTTCFAIV